MRTGIMQLPLHDGRAPRWLAERMKMLSYLIARAIVLEHGHREFLARLSDPLWFQAFGCVLGYDWHSSGITTVVTGVLKQALIEHGYDLGIMIAGGKGKAMSGQRMGDEIDETCTILKLGSRRRDEMLYASRMAAKVDNTLLQDGHSIYHHAFIIAEDGTWAVVQQGMDAHAGTARRYHWLSSRVRSFVDEPRSGIIGSDVITGGVLDMTARESEECRKVCVDLANDINTVSSVQLLYKQSTLDGWINGSSSSDSSNSSDHLVGDYNRIKYGNYDNCNYNCKGNSCTDGISTINAFSIYSMPEEIDWSLFKRIYDVHPSSYEQLIAIKGVGSSTVRALALIAELIYGVRASWKDPVRFTFAHGGKDGVPYPVDRKVYDESIKVLRDAIEGLDVVNSNTKMGMLKRLARFDESK